MILRKRVVFFLVVGVLASCIEPAPAVSPLGSSPVSTPVSDFTPVGAIALDKTTPWSDPAQQVVVYQTSNKQYGIRILSGTATLTDSLLPVSEVFEDIIFSGEESSSAREIGIITSVTSDSYQVRVYDVNLRAFVPEKGTGNVTFVSAHVPPFLADLDNDTVPELVTAFDDANLPTGFVNSRIYVLSDGTYAKSDFLVLPPRELPSSP